MRGGAVLHAPGRSTSVSVPGSRTVGNGGAAGALSHLRYPRLSGAVRVARCITSGGGDMAAVPISELVAGLHPHHHAIHDERWHIELAPDRTLTVTLSRSHA